MSRQTTNYGLTKPDYTDIADIEVVNANMDIIDGALKVIDTKSNNVMSKNSSAWSSTVAYAVGQYCIYNNSLWKCLVQHSGQTPQEGTYWARVSLDTLGSEINALNNNLTWKRINKESINNTTETTISTNMNMSNLKEVIIILTIYGSVVQETIHLPYSIFSNGQDFTITDAKNNQYGVVTYVNSLSIKAKVSHSNWCIQIYGR